jgi:hypothetical protein
LLEYLNSGRRDAPRHSEPLKAQLLEIAHVVCKEENEASSKQIKNNQDKIHRKEFILTEYLLSLLHWFGQ